MMYRCKRFQYWITSVDHSKNVKSQSKITVCRMGNIREPTPWTLDFSHYFQNKSLWRKKGKGILEAGIALLYYIMNSHHWERSGCANPSPVVSIRKASRVLWNIFLWLRNRKWMLNWHLRKCSYENKIEEDTLRFPGLKSFPKLE